MELSGYLVKNGSHCERMTWLGIWDMMKQSEDPVITFEVSVTVLSIVVNGMKGQYMQW